MKTRMDWKVWQCEVCGWIYDEEKGWPQEGIAPGTRWEDIPEDWTCPECLATKKDFIMVEIGPQQEVSASDLEWRKPTEDARFSGQPIVIIGSGLAGYDLVKEIRGTGDTSEIVMITADDGAYYPKPVISKSLSQGKDAADIIRHTAEEMAAEYRVQILTDTCVEEINPKRQQLTLSQGSKQSYRKLVLATGAKSITPQLGGNAKDKIFQVNNLDDYTRFKAAITNKKRILVIGGGLIGCEYANDLVAAGKDVTVIEALDAPLATILPKEASAAVRDGLEGAGVKFHCGRMVKQVDNTGNDIKATLDNGDTIEADLVLVAIGVAPDLTLAQKAGLVTNRGIVVNRFLETSEINIFALGDAAEMADKVLPFVMPLTAQVRALAQTLTNLNTMVYYGVMPVHIKTPTVPVIFYHAGGKEAAQWQVVRDGIHCRALCKTTSGKLRGIALTGKYVDEKNDFIEQLPPLIGKDEYVLPNGKYVPEDFYHRPQGFWETLRHAWWGA